MAAKTQTPPIHWEMQSQPASNFGFSPGHPPIMQNKPNFRRGTACRAPTMQNEPNLPHPHRPHDPNIRNEPNSAHPLNLQSTIYNPLAQLQ